MESPNEQERIENDCVEPISLVFPRRLVHKATRLPTPIYNFGAQPSARCERFPDVANHQCSTFGATAQD
jgi:hypothetical protein